MEVLDDIEGEEVAEKDFVLEEVPVGENEGEDEGDVEEEAEGEEEKPKSSIIAS